MDVLTGLGLSSSAGLNAWIPLLVLGLLDRYTEFVDLGPNFAWLSNGWVLAIFAVLLALEVVADKVPAIDSVNDVIQTVVRPTSGGIVFGSSMTSDIAGLTLGGETATVTDPEQFVTSGTWVPIVIGVVLALVVHGVKALTRPVANTASAGAAAPVLSTAEDVVAVVISLLAVFLPILVLLGLVGLVFGTWWLLRRRRPSGPPVYAA
ncbi:DUF4126 domain-containing protein [Kocuria sp. JC486]|uniref:DUF4126 domain-containing protein n=1 Tax=Kocuria soli TaxID=2485125 RepID=A0A3N4AFN3_9MICC|nr:MULTISPECIES: DUF4126 domain-containing protein [Kocuria]NHU86169.1 DUF4126 domain-containing protein [Kocuria sp. JC486]ROZ65699.1 DUF4126 domain-containing protein [Kocuria soli]